MHLHLLGICGTFMGSLALIARRQGHRVTGSDCNVYPPMSTQLAAQGIDIWPGYEPLHLQPAPDLVIVGNALSRGNPAVEYLLDVGLPYTSGPQWLGEQVLHGRHVIAVSGTHGKTTTSAMLAWILEHCGLQPGFLIGGVPANFDGSARLGGGDFFVIEADEYDTAFFDKRSKFLHYRPRTLVINNLEYDHADIFPDLQSIQRQFHQLLRTVPAAGRLIVPAGEPAVDEVLDMGRWSALTRFGLHRGDWQAQRLSDDGRRFAVRHGGASVGDVAWPLQGDHNIANALAAIAAACEIGVAPPAAVDSLCQFAGVKRRLECIGEVDGITVYDDFAHHPTAIGTTLAGLRRAPASGRLIAVLEPRSNTMKLGVHRDRLEAAVADADHALWLQPAAIDWSLAEVLDIGGGRHSVCRDVDELLMQLTALLLPGDRVVLMSNGAFGGLHQRLLSALARRVERTP